MKQTVCTSAMKTERRWYADALERTIHGASWVLRVHGDLGAIAQSEVAIGVNVEGIQLGSGSLRHTRPDVVAARAGLGGGVVCLKGARQAGEAISVPGNQAI